LKRKDFIKEAVDLSSSRSLAEGGMWAGQKIENEMEDMYGLLRDTRGFVKDNDYSLLELLVCVMMIEYSHEIKKKNRDEVVKMIENYFSNRVYYQKYLKK